MWMLFRSSGCRCRKVSSSFWRFKGAIILFPRNDFSMFTSKNRILYLIMLGFMDMIIYRCQRFRARILLLRCSFALLETSWSILISWSDRSVALPSKNNENDNYYNWNFADKPCYRVSNYSNLLASTQTFSNLIFWFS